MTGNQWHDRLDKLRSACDRALDTATSIGAFSIEILRHTLEIEGLTAGTVFQFNSPEPQILVEEGLKKLFREGMYILDMDHTSMLRESIQQQKVVDIDRRCVPEVGLLEHSGVIAAVPSQNAPFYVIELAATRNFSREEFQHLREIVRLLATYIQQFLQEGTKQQEAPEDTGTFWERFDQFVLRLQRSLHLKETVAVAVNDGRSLIGCDRVSIALRHGSRAKVYGVSGQEDVAQRANLVQAMAVLTNEVIRGGQPVVYRGTIDGLAPQVEKPLAEYLAESRTRMVMLIPLREPEELIKDEPENTGRRQEKPRRVIGCLVVEQAAEARPRTNVVQRTELLTEHIETAIHNAQRYESIFLLPLWRFIGRTIGWFKGRRVWAALAIIAGIALVGAGLAYIPWEYRVEAKGLAMPVDQHEVFAPWDGDVVTVYVESGQRVEFGEKLVLLQSDELDAEKVRIVSEVNELKKTVLQRQAEARSADSRPADERIRIEFEAKKAEIELQGALDRLKVVEDRIANLLVTAPAPGVVATFQVKQLLQNRPVRRGELLMQVMDDTGEWRLELEVPEYRKGHIERAIANSGDEKLRVEYVLATAVETSHEGHVTLISNRSNQSPEEGTIVEVHAAINKEDLGNRNIGADVTAKIHCGKKNLFYVLFGDVVEFVQRYFWL